MRNLRPRALASSYDSAVAISADTLVESALLAHMGELCSLATGNLRSLLSGGQDQLEGLTLTLETDAFLQPMAGGNGWESQKGPLTESRGLTLAVFPLLYFLRKLFFWHLSPKQHSHFFKNCQCHVPPVRFRK